MSVTITGLRYVDPRTGIEYKYMVQEWNRNPNSNWLTATEGWWEDEDGNRLSPVPVGLDF